MKEKLFNCKFRHVVHLYFCVFIKQNFTRILYVFRDTPVEGFSDDYSFLIYGLLELYEASFDEQWLEWAAQLQEKQNELLWDDEAGGYFEGGKQSKLLLRLKQGIVKGAKQKIPLGKLNFKSL